jgi:hypothetical protein
MSWWRRVSVLKPELERLLPRSVVTHQHGLVTGKKTDFLINSDMLIANVGTKNTASFFGCFLQ